MVSAWCMTRSAATGTVSSSSLISAAASADSSATAPKYLPDQRDGCGSRDR